MGRAPLLSVSMALGIVVLTYAPGIGSPPPAPIRQELGLVYGRAGEVDLKLDLYAPQGTVAALPRGGSASRRRLVQGFP